MHLEGNESMRLSDKIINIPFVDKNFFFFLVGETVIWGHCVSRFIEFALESNTTSDIFTIELSNIKKKKCIDIIFIL